MRRTEEKKVVSATVAGGAGKGQETPSGGRPPAGQRRVAVYARVSTLREEQEESYEFQKSYYEKRIAADPSLTLVHVYGDQGISAGSMKKRTQFLQMMQDCRDGKIDLIMTKSISRFARNLADCLECMRELRTLGVPVVFENEGISTENASGEFLISILSAVAQQELNERSQSIRWAYKKNSQRGRPTARVCYGYRRGTGSGETPAHTWEIYEPEAKRVRLMFALAAQGCSYHEICEALDALEASEGSAYRWYYWRIRHILTHEAYVGDLLTNKYVTVDYLRKKQTRNRGMTDQFYLEGHHPPLVDRARFEQVQQQIRDGKLRSRPGEGRPCRTRRTEAGGESGTTQRP